MVKIKSKIKAWTREPKIGSTQNTQINNIWVLAPLISSHFHHSSLAFYIFLVWQPDRVSEASSPVLTITTGAVRGVGGVMRATCSRPHISGVMCSDVYCNILIGGNAPIVVPCTFIYIV